MDERHDVITAEDMKQALESHGGLRGCRAAVVEVDTTKAVGNDNKIPGISLINNFLFEEGGIRTWKAYNVGPGRYLAYDELSFEKQGDTGLKVIQPFSPRTKDRGIREIKIEVFQDFPRTANVKRPSPAVRFAV